MNSQMKADDCLELNERAEALIVQGSLAELYNDLFRGKIKNEK